MINPKDPITCRACALNRALIAKLDERLTALETDVRGSPADVLLEEFVSLIRFGGQFNYAA